MNNQVQYASKQYWRELSENWSEFSEEIRRWAELYEENPDYRGESDNEMNEICRLSLDTHYIFENRGISLF